MAVRSCRISTLRALAAGAKSRASARSYDHVDEELKEIITLNRVSPERRRNLLQVFHGMRALESGIKETIRGHGIGPEKTLGGLLYQMNRLPPNHSCHMDAGNLGRFLSMVRADRNRIMHEANAFPRTNRECDRIMGEITACFTQTVK